MSEIQAKAEKSLIPAVMNETDLRSLVYVIRGQQVMLDSDLAALYQVETKVFNQAVSRNIERFPENFRFQLTAEEYVALRSQLVTSNPGAVVVGICRMPLRNRELPCCPAYCAAMSRFKCRFAL